MNRALAALALVAAAPAPAPVVDGRIAALRERLFPALAALAATRPTVPPARAARAAACGGDAPACVQAAIWTAPEIDGAVALAARTAGIPANADQPPAAAVAGELAALDEVLGVYGANRPPRYPLIDGPVFAATTKQGADDIAAAVEIGGLSRDPPGSLGQSLALALALLEANRREDAIAFDPLDVRENAGARAVAARTDWRRFRYTVLIVPGIGPEDPAAAISPRGRLHALLAAERFRAGLAPLILVSGGAVHPRGTRFVEAVEMRRFLVERLGVPADRVILEPYARHTTTNLRNATRRLVALGVPIDRPALIVSNRDQSGYIEGTRFTDRNRSELGYQPGAIGRRLSPYDLEFRPSRLSLRRDARDPLDP